MLRQLIEEAMTAIFGTSNDDYFTSASKIPYFNNVSGQGFLPKGLASVSKFTSVLGAFVTLAASESSTPDTFEGIARLRKNILMAVPTAVINTGKFQDMPERGFGFFINLFIGGSSLQFYVRDSTLRIYCRDINGGSSIVSDWYKLTNTPV